LRQYQIKGLKIAVSAWIDRNRRGEGP
jgi:hypothetical protein